MFISSFFFISCDYDTEEHKLLYAGNLQIIIDNDIISNRKNITPENYIQELSSFNILFLGPYGEEILYDNFIDNNLILENISLGEWNVQVTAFNSLNEIIGDGADSAIVTRGSLAEIIIIIDLLEF